MTKIVSAALLVLSCGSALGADLLQGGVQIIPAPTALSTVPVSSWSGFYLGANGGGGFGDVSTSALAEIAAPPLLATRLQLDRSGPIGGLQAGFALQTGVIVYGIEADMSFGAIRGRMDVASQDGSVTGKLESKIRMLGTVRSRFGFAFDHLLIYGTGGFATGYHEAKSAMTIKGGGASAGTLTEWVPGWTMGLGAEYAFADHMSLKLEYLYAHLNNSVLGQPAAHSLNFVRAGVNYRF